MFDFKVIFPSGTVKRVYAANITEAEDKVVNYMQAKCISTARLAGKTTLTEIKKTDSKSKIHWRHKGYAFFPASNLTPFQINHLFNECFA